jgi:hypothetical protein
VKLTARNATTSRGAHSLQGLNGRGARLGAGRNRVRIPLAFFPLAALFLLLLAPVSQAATPISSYGYLATFGSGQAFFTGPAYNGVAVDGSSGNILVAEFVNEVSFWGAVQIYSPDPSAGGVPLANIDLEASQITPTDVAVDQTDSSLYIVDGSTKTISKWVSDGAATPTYTQDTSFVSPVGLLTLEGGLAVDPVTHDILVGDRNTKRVYRLDPTTGALISSFDASDGTDKPNAPSSTIASLATGPDGTIYVADDFDHQVRRFSPAGVLLGSLPLPAGFGASMVVVNPQTGDAAVLASGKGQTFIEGFNSVGQLTFSSRIPPQVEGEPTGLAWDSSTDRIYLSTSTGTVHTFVPATQPGLDQPVVSGVTGTSAHVVAAIAPGGETTTARIEYCPAAAACSNYLVSEPGNESNPWKRLLDHAELSGSGEELIEDDLTELEPNTAYLVRSSATNALTENTSTSATLTTKLVPPIAQTGLAGSVTDTQAELTGTITTFGDQTTYRFEYGLDATYGMSVPVGAEGIAGNSRTARTFSRTVSGLQPGTTYHYRLVARNAAGKTDGSDHTFTTQSPAEVAIHRSYEEVSPVDKRGTSILSFGAQAAADGSAIAYTVVAAGEDGNGAPLSPLFLSRRGSSDWDDWQPIDPPLNVSRLLVGTATQAVSDDFTHALVVSNRVLAPGAIEGGGNVYVVDLRTNTYTLVGAAGGLSAYLMMNGFHPPNMYMAGAPDFSWIVLASEPPLLPNVQGAALYKWTAASGLELESRLPGGAIPDGSVSMASKGVLTTHIVSDDGNTMYFALEGPGAGVYRRSEGQTTAISVSEIQGDPATPLPGEIDGVSADGRYAFFRSGRLTPDAPAVPPNLQPADLYRYDADSGQLTYVGSAATRDQGRVISTSDDGSTVYYNHRTPLGVIPEVSDTVVWRNGVSQSVTSGHPDTGPGGMEALSSPNGRFLAYRLEGNVFLFDAETGQTSCVSCKADGSSGSGGGPELALGTRGFSNHAERVVIDDGTVFFDTTLPLVTADHNGTRDVYAYRGGHLTLISPGDGNFVARFLDATPDGRSVFFATAESLVGRDTDKGTDVYVARVGEGFASQSPPPAAPPCSGDSCQGSLANPPLPSTAGSVLGTGFANRPRKAKQGHGAKKCRKGVKGRKCRKAHKSSHQSAKLNHGGAK